MRKITFNESKEIIEVILKLADDYKKGRFDKKILEEVITKIYKDSEINNNKKFSLDLSQYAFGTYFIDVEVEGTTRLIKKMILKNTLQINLLPSGY